MYKKFLLFMSLFSTTLIPADQKQLITALELAAQLPAQTTKSSSQFEDQVKGIWNLGAYGDAQGGVTEFITDINILKAQRPDDPTGYPIIPKLSSLPKKGGGFLGFGGYVKFTDDTHMSLYIAHALLKSKGQSVATIMDTIAANFFNWLKADQTDRAPGIAATNNIAALQKLGERKESGAGAHLWSRGLLDSLDIDKTGQGLLKELWNKEGGCGSVMRTAPVSIMFKDNPKLAEQIAVGQSIFSHTDSGARAACAGFNAALITILNHLPIEQVWQAAIQTAQKYDSRTYSQAYDPIKYHYGSGHISKNGCAAMCNKAWEYVKYVQHGVDAKPYQEVLDEFRGWGATEALAATLYIFARWNNDPYTAMTVAINRTPGDSDSIAQMVGQLLGAQYGYSGIVTNFAKHRLNFTDELKHLENINNLPEYPTDFPVFEQLGIATFNDLARVISSL